jgi:type II secretory pathway pseudopilin PulG
VKRITLRTGGFSLVEALVAIMILGVGIVGISEGITTALRSTKDAERETIASLLAAGRIELLRADGFITDGEEEGDFEDEFPLYRWRQRTTPAGISGLHEVLVTIELAATGQKVFELRTMLFDAPLDFSTGTEPARGGPDGARRRLRS